MDISGFQYNRGFVTHGEVAAAPSELLEPALTEPEPEMIDAEKVVVAVVNTGVATSTSLLVARILWKGEVYDLEK